MKPIHTLKMNRKLSAPYISKTQINFLILIFCIFLIVSCKTSKTISSPIFQNDFLIINGQTCSETKDPNVIDNQAGTIDCGSISFSYDYGKYSYQGPITPKEEFRRSFDTYHHIKFFENRMIDPKVYKIFLDSVKVVNVERKKSSDKLMFDCEPCNSTAEVIFKGDTYFYPFTLSENQLKMVGHTSTFEESNGFIYKYFKEDEGSHGLYVSPIRNTYKKKNTLSLIVKQTTLSDIEVDALLKKVQMVNQ